MRSNPFHFLKVWLYGLNLFAETMRHFFQTILFAGLFYAAFFIFCDTSSYAQGPVITEGTTARFDTKGAPDPISWSWFQSIEGDKVTVLYENKGVAKVIKGKLFSPKFTVNGDATYNFGNEENPAVVRSIARIEQVVFSENNGLTFDNISRRWILYTKDKELLRKQDLSEKESKEYANFLFMAGKRHQNILVTAAGLQKNWKEGSLSFLETSFEIIKFRKDNNGYLTLALITKPHAKIYIPPIIANILPELFGEFLPLQYDLWKITKNELNFLQWPYSSSTDVIVTKGPHGSLVAEGQLEFLLLGWNQIVPNFGEGCRLKVLKDAGPVQLINGYGEITRVEDGTYCFLGQKWVKCTDR
ncbi:MAG: hypothetical protein FD156_583 [Nitrospirae bacterium]|nr:MAG: hypothetical protein FD156_583 [Nitrospirota bacterium]